MIVSEEKTKNLDDREYHDFIEAMNNRFFARFGNGKTPLFKTDMKGLFAVYLETFQDPIERQYHNCSCCHAFMSRYGSLVYVDDNGSPRSAVWDEADAPQEYKATIRAMVKKIERAKIVSPFLTSENTLGQFEAGGWKHFALRVPVTMKYTGRHQTAGQTMAEKREDFKNVMRALGEFSHATVQTALTVLRADALYRSEKVLGAAEWLESLYSIKGNRNLMWKAIATAPAGFCHPRSSMIGTLLEDIEAGMEFSVVSKRFADKMHPLRYQRPQAAPAAGAIKQAEKLFQDMGLAASLRRRFARFDEIEKFWTPTPKAAPQSDSIFGHLEAKNQPTVKSLNLPAQVMTWVKFRDTVLPSAEQIQFPVPSNNLPLTAIVTAADPEAPPLLQWDNEGQRNPFSTYVWNGGSRPDQFKLRAGSIVNVEALTLRPHKWYGGEYPNQSEGVIFILEGAQETRNGGLALFPEILRSEVKGVRSVIEAYSNKGQLEGMEEGGACGLLLDKNSKWNFVFRVTAAGHTMDYKIDRWD